MADLRVVVAGAGFIARRWIETIAATPGVVLAGVASRSAARATAAIEHAGLAGVPIYADLQLALAADITDAVIVTLPQALHPVAVVTALRAGLHVLVEKPLAVDREGVRAIQDAAREHGDRTVMVNQNFRWRPHVQALRHAVRDGLAGDIGHVMFECRQQIRRTTIDGWRERMAEPFLLDFAIHHVDLIRHVLGDEYRAVEGRSFRPAWSWFDGNAAAVARIETVRGTQVAYDGTMVSTGFETPQEGVITLLGSRGALRLDRDSVVRLSIDGAVRDLPTSPIEGGEFGYALREFASAVRDGRAPEVTLEEHVRSLDVVFGIIESARTGARVQLR